MLKPYDIYMIDPPWFQEKTNVKRRPNEKEWDYPTMPVSKIFSLLHNEILVNTYPHVVFLWTIEKYLVDAILEMQFRDYKKHCTLVWDKGNGPISFTVRHSHEYLIWFYKNKMLKISEESIGKFPTTFYEAHREHSRKPDAAYHLIDAWYPDKTKIDIFSREWRHGWAQWGNEVKHFKNI